VFTNTFGLSRHQEKTEVALKRRRLQNSSAVITHDEYISAAYGGGPTNDQKERPVIFHTTEFEEVIIPDIPPSPISSVAIPVQFPRPVVNEEDFVLFRVVPTGKRRESVYFAGSVIKKLNTDLEIKCMRRKGISGARFVYPSADDIESYELKDVAMILDNPKIVRNVFNFPNDLSSYNLR
jgi:hypothetical protein